MKRLAIKCLAVPFVLALLGASNARVVRFPGGEALIERHGTYEEVTIKTARGDVSSISACDASSGTYDQIVRFSTALKDAVRRGDRKTAAALMAVPLRVNTGPGKGYEVPSRLILTARFNRIFSSKELRALADMEPHDVFCRNGMSMIAGGVIWAQVRGGVLRGVVVNAQP